MSQIPGSPFIQINRNKLRQRLLKNRTLNPSADQTINQSLSTLLRHLAPRSIGLYWPIHGEVDIRPSVTEWFSAQPDMRQMALPYAKEREALLHFLVWQPTHPMTTDAYGIPIPQEVHEVVPDLLLLPCIGFTQATNKQYYRLGYGAGCYDKTLAKLNIPCIGVAYEAARTNELLPEPHDQPMTYIITETGYYKSD